MTDGTGPPPRPGREMVAARSVPLAASDDLDPHEARVLLRLALLKPRSLGAAGAAFQEH